MRRLVAHGGFGKIPPDVAAIQLRWQVAAVCIQSLKDADVMSLRRIISGTGMLSTDCKRLGV
jgi:hypothetical protein